MASNVADKGIKQYKSLGPSCKKREQKLFDGNFVLFLKKFLFIYENWWAHHKNSRNVTKFWLVTLEVYTQPGANEQHPSWGKMKSGTG